MAKPTHTLYVKRKGTKHGRRVGVGWMNSKGWIYLRLDICTHLTDDTEIYINLYPRVDRETYDVDNPTPDPGEPPEYLNAPLVPEDSF
jgi:hypothetical protein